MSHNGELTVSPELALLLELVRLGNGSPREPFVDVDRPSMNWDLFTRLSFRHGLNILVWRTLESQSIGSVPSAVAGALGQEYQRTAHKSTLLTDELVRTMEVFDRSGVRALPFKGPSLAHEFYGDVCQRSFNDLDILIDGPEFAAATRILVERGYEIIDADDGQLTATKLRRQVAPDVCSEIDLHRRLSQAEYPFPLAFDKLWQRRQFSEIGGAVLPRFAHEDLLLELCVHGARHVPYPWCRLLWVADVDRFLANETKVDWPAFLARATNLGIRRVAASSLLLASEIFRNTLPDCVQQCVSQDATALALVRQVKPWALWSNGLTLGVFDAHRWRLRSRERFRDRLTYAVFLGKLCVSKALLIDQGPEADKRGSRLARGLRLMKRPFDLLLTYGLPFLPRHISGR